MLTSDDKQVFDHIQNTFNKEVSETKQVIDALIDSDVFKTKIDVAISEKTKEMVELKSFQIRSEAEDNIKEQRQKLDTLNAEVKELQDIFDRKKRQKGTELEKELEKQREDFHESLKAERITIAEQKEELTHQQDVLKESLEQVVDHDQGKRRVTQ